jgi:hypothetical protein
MNSHLLTQDRVKDLLHYCPKTGIFARLVTCGGQLPGSIPGRINSNGYRDISIDGRRYMAHRLAWFYVYGFYPRSEIDHINRIKSDNRIANLRLASRKQNCENVGKRQSNTSGITGVDLRYGKWRVRINHYGKSIFIGSFNTLEDAYLARIAAQNRFHAYAPNL